MPFTDEQPFLDAVFARYHDDGPRLIYADFLEDRGDPERAELVRVQLALARMNEEHPRRPELANREAEILNLNRDRWTAHLAGLIAGVEFRRGIPDSVSVDSAVFLSRGDELFASVRVRRLRLLDDSSLLPKIIHSSRLANIRELDLCDNDLGNGGVNLLARSEHLKKLVWLDLGFNGVDDEGVVSLARASTLPALTSLALNDNGRITSDGLKALADSPFFAGLTTLNMSGNDINDIGVRAALTSPSFARLHTLKLSHNPIGDAGVAALARSSLFDRMLSQSSRLDLRGHAGGPIGPLGIAALVQTSAMTKCVTLDLTGNDVGDRGLFEIVSSPYIPNLRVLKLGRNQISDAGILAVRDVLGRFMTQLRALDLSENRLTKHGLSILKAATPDLSFTLDTTGNVQSAGGTSPVQVGEVVPGVLRDVTDAAVAAELRRRITHPATRVGDRNIPPG